MQRGFSLVELSIVLVILGLLTGGILAGQSLIRAAELRAVSTEYQRYLSAVNSFRGKYTSLPGDMINATSYWGKDNVNCSGDTGTTMVPGTCNGNGNGSTADAAGAGLTGETFQLWKHLALAGLIEGTYTGLSGSGGATHTVLGSNSPASKLSSAGWGTSSLDSTAVPSTTNFQMDYGSHFVFGAQTAANSPRGIILKTEELWNIDTKLDDGRPGRGKVIAQGIDTCTTATAGTQLDADYLLTSSAAACAIRFPQSIQYTQ